MELMIELSDTELDLISGGAGSASLSLSATASGTNATVSGTATIATTASSASLSASALFVLDLGYHRRDPRCDLIKKTHYFRYVADIVWRQFGDHDVMRIGVDAYVQLAPASA